MILWYLKPLQPQFVDINLSDDYHLKTESNAMWRPVVPTMATSSRIFARVELEDGFKLWAMLPGWFCLMAVGHSLSEIPDKKNCKVLRRMSGNAFSIGSIGPQLVGFFAAWRNPLLTEP